jgi:hypothetical protein
MHQILLGGYMSIIRSVVCIAVVASCASLFSQDQSKPPLRDPRLIEVLSRVVNAAGGVRALAAVHDLSESGEITFYWAKDQKGPVSIQGLGGNHFRMEANLPQGNRVWLVNDGNGSRKEADQKAVALPYGNAINLGNLTFPVAHVAAVLADPLANVSLVGIEKRDGRSIYHLQLKGRLGLVGNGTPAGPFVKDILVDALNYSILAMQDYPYSRKSPENQHNLKKSNAKASPISPRETEFEDPQSKKLNTRNPDIPPREIEYEDFRVVEGIQVPFLIKTKLEGQQTFSIRLDEVKFNNNLNIGDFTK